MRNKILLIVSIYFIILILGLVSCEKCGPFPSNYKVIGMESYLSNLVYSDTTEQDYMLKQITNDTVDYSSYSILLIPETETYFASKNLYSFSLITSAYACSPVIPTSDEKIDSIQIITNSDFDNTHPSGSNLADIFDVIINDYENGINNQRYQLQDYTDSKPYVSSEIILLLKNAPNETKEFEFTIKYYQDGISYDYFELIADAVVIMK